MRGNIMTKKPLSIRVKTIKFDGKQLFILKIDHQEFAYDKFTTTGNSTFTATNGFMLSSTSFPEIQEGNNKLHVLGQSKAKSDTAKILTTNSKVYIDKLKVAVREYNVVRVCGNDQPKCSKDELIIE